MNQITPEDYADSQRRAQLAFRPNKERRKESFDRVGKFGRQVARGGQLTGSVYQSENRSDDDDVEGASSLVEHVDQAAIIAAACKLFTDRGWSELALGHNSFTVQKADRVFSCFLYPTDKVIAFRDGSQKLSDTIPEPFCLVLTMEEHQCTQRPIYVGVGSLKDIPSLVGVNATALEAKDVRQLQQ